MDYCVWFIVGVLVGSIISNIIFYVRSSSGTLRIDHSNPEKDVYRLEVNSLDKLSKKKRVILKVDSHADLSQE